MKTRSIASIVLLSFLPHAVVLPAFAQPADDPMTTQARARFKEGVEFYDKGQFENARLAFLQAYALKKHPAVLLNLAQSSAKSGHALEASKYFQQFLRESTTVTPQQRTDAENGLAEVRQKLGRIEIVAPAGTEITLDDKDKVGTAPIVDPVDVEPGAHTLKSPTETVRVTANAGQKVQAKFGGAGAAPPAVVPIPPTAPPSTPPETKPDQPPTSPPQQPPDTTKKYNVLSPPENMTPVFIGLGIGGAGLVSAIIFAAFKSDAQSKADSVASDIRKAAQARGITDTRGVCSRADLQKDFGGACATLKDNNDKVDTNATIANVSLGVMAAGFVFAGVYYLVAKKKGSDEAAQVQGSRQAGPILTPYAGWRESGLSLSGSF